MGCQKQVCSFTVGQSGGQRGQLGVATPEGRGQQVVQRLGLRRRPDQHLRSNRFVLKLIEVKTFSLLSNLILFPVSCFWCCGCPFCSIVGF